MQLASQVLNVWLNPNAGQRSHSISDRRDAKEQKMNLVGQRCTFRESCWKTVEGLLVINCPPGQLECDIWMLPRATVRPWAIFLHGSGVLLNYPFRGS